MTEFLVVICIELLCISSPDLALLLGFGCFRYYTGKFEHCKMSLHLDKIIVVAAKLHLARNMLLHGLNPISRGTTTSRN